MLITKQIWVSLLAIFAVLPLTWAFSPQPVSVTTNSGMFSYTAGTRLFYMARKTSRPVEDSLQPLAEVLAGELEMITGIKPAIFENSGVSAPGPGDISLEFAPISGTFASSEEEEDQSYRLEVSDIVRIRSEYFKGVAYGSTTLLQAIVDTAGIHTVPKLTISDRAVTPYRGVMIDVARQPSSVAALKQVVRLARLYKLRYLQLHLTDDQHFTFPFTPVTSKLSGNFTYARSDLVDLAAYADARGVTIIPELDLPGHSGKLRASGYLNPSSNDADVAHPNNHARIQAIVDDMLEVFPNAPYFHVGGDESGAGRALVPFLGAINNHLRGKPAGHKKRLLVWEGFHGAPTNDLPATGDNRVVVFSWESSYNAPWDLLTSGYQIINGSWKPLYLVGSGATTRYPHVSQRLWSPEVLHTWDKDTFMHWEPGRPVFEDRGPGDTNRNDSVWNANWINRQSQVLGGQLLSWEQNEKSIVSDLLPCLPVVADRLWNPRGGEDYATFKARLEAVRERALAIVRPAEILPLSAVHDSPLNLDYRTYSGTNVTITLRNRTKIAATIRYTTGTFNNDRTAANFSPVPEPAAFYKPAGDVFPGPNAANLIAGQFYQDWVPNDHCFVRDESGRWHAFGITHPLTDVSNVHAGENLLFHAIAPPGALKESLKEGSWKDLPKVLPPSERPGEMPAIHAPWILKRNGLFHMVYGPTPIRYATASGDLSRWTPKGNLRGAPSGRDPQVFVWNDTYHLIVCGVEDVRVSTSKDLKTWTEHGPLMKLKKVDPESPSLVRYNGTFYLFVCGWDGVWDKKDIQGAYQHKTYVYQSDDPLKFEREVAVLDAHAPEIFQDEAGDWFISSVEWPHRGVSIARLVWE